MSAALRDRSQLTPRRTIVLAAARGVCAAVFYAVLVEGTFGPLRDLMEKLGS